MKSTRLVRGSLSTRNARLIALAAASVPFIVSTARATYTDADTFIGVTSATTFTAATLNDPAEWSTGALPTVTELAVFPSTVNVSIATPKPSPNVTMYMYALSSSSNGSTGGTIANGQAIGFLSTDITSDGVSTAPALQATTGATGQAIDIKTPIVLGNAASGTLQMATFDNSIINGAITTEGSISEFAGSTWGINITGTKTVQFKGSFYSGSGFAYSGDTIIADGANLRLFNNLIPHGVGRGNLVINGAGILQMSLNGGYQIVNAFNGSSTSSVTKPGSAPELAFGANDASGEFDGLFNDKSLQIAKVGTGTETLTNAGNLITKTVTVTGGFLAVTSIGNGNVASALGAGLVATNATAAAALLLDGGAVKYTGAAASSDRLFTIGASGGGFDSSGTGPLNLTNTGAETLVDTVSRLAEDVSGTAATLQTIYMPETAGLIANMTVTGGNVGTGNSITTVNDGTHVTLAIGRTTQIPSGFGASMLTFTLPAGTLPNRTFTFSGSNTGLNTVAATFTDSPTGKLSIAKTGPGTWALSGANTYTGNTTVSGGALILSGSAAAAPILTGTGANLQAGELVFDYTGQTSQAATIATLVQASAASGFTTGQFRSSTVAADASHLTTIGYGDAADLGLSLGGTPLTSAVVVKATYVGDASLDGKVDLGNDFPLFLQGYINHGTAWDLGDFNNNGVVDNTDFGLFIDGLKGQGGSLGELDDLIAVSPLLSNAQKASLLAVVPEPTMLGAMAVAGLGMLSRRRRK